MARLAALFLLSGAAALVVETTWLRWFRLLFGATAPAASATLVAFFAGNALGAAWAARRAARWRAPLRVYAALEIGAALGALVVPLLLGAGERVASAAYDPLRVRPALLVIVRFGIALAASLPAATAIGATLPAIGAAAMRRASALGTRGAALYAWNTAGAALGAAAAAFVLPDWIGVRATYGVGVALQLGVGGLAWRLAARHPAPLEDAAPAAGHRQCEPAAAQRPGPRILLALAALSGLVALAGQVLLVQSFGQVLDQSVYAFGAVLVVVLATLAAGAGVAARLDARGARPDAVLQIGLGGAALAWLAFPAVFHAATGGLAYVETDLPWPAALVAPLGLALAVAGPPLFFSALVLPATFALAGRSRDSTPGAVLGRLAAANTLGAIAGALAATWVLLPLLGPFGAFAALAALPALACLAAGPGAGRRAALLGLAGALLLAVANPFTRAPVRLEPGETLVELASTPGGVVAVVDRPDGRLIRTDNHYALGGTAEVGHELRQGHLPLLLHPRPRRVAYVGTATGITAAAATVHPVTSIHLVEIVPAVSRAAQRHFAAANRGVHVDPRTVVVNDDARNFMRSTHETFDVVVADLFVPWRSGTGSLYTLEHFRAVRARLRDDGLFCQWLPLYQLNRDEFDIIARTFLEVFPNAGLFRGDFYGGFPIVALVGFRGRPPRVAEVAAASARLRAAGEPDRWLTDPIGFWSLYVGELGSLRAALADVPLNRDDRPHLQYRAARSHSGAPRARAFFVGSPFAYFAETLRSATRARGDTLFPDLPPPALRAMQAGSLLQQSGAAWSEGRRNEAALALTQAAERLPAGLLAEGAPDPSAAEVWPGR